MMSSNEEERDVVDVLHSDDVLLEIFAFLPADMLIQFRIVCKFWFNLITSNIRNPKFSEMHTQHHHHHPSHATITTSTIDNLPTILCTSTSTRPIPYHILYSLNNPTSTTSSSSSSSSSLSYKNKKIEALEIVYPFKSPSSEVKILGSCNGLLCIQVTDYNIKNDDYACTSNRKRGTVVICLWNPTTTEFKQVPVAAPDELIRVSKNKNVYGFGFDRSIKDYKLVKLMKFTNDGESYEIIIKVYTLGTNSWKRVRVKNNINIPYILLKLWSQMGLYVDGVLHWLGRRIYSFNIQEEEFGVVPKPECPKKMWFEASLQVLRGCLCTFSSYVDPNPNRIFEVWMMMDYGVKESWTKLFSVNIDLGWNRAGPWENLKPLWICNNGEVLIGSDGVQCSSKHLVIYDPNNDKIIKSIGIQGIPLNRIKEMVHIRSFVSLKSGTYVDQEQSKKINKKTRVLIL